MLSLIAQISDSHVGAGEGGSRSAAALAAAVEAIGALEPAPVAVLFTGDIAADGRPEEYARVRELLAPLTMPVHPLMGNHDDREALRAAFSDHPGVAAAGEFIQYTAQCGPVTLIVGDTKVPGSDDGRLGAERLGWIEAELERAAGSPTVLALHHSPILTGMYQFDNDIPLAAEDRAGLAALPVRPDLIACGHIHMPIRGTLGPTPVFVCPSVHLQAEFNLSAEADVRLIEDPPGYALHLYGADPALVSYVRPLPAA